MKKKVLIVIVIILFLLTVLIFGKKSISENSFRVCQIETGSINCSYETIGTVKAEMVYLTIETVADKIFKQENEKVTKGETILSYTNLAGKKSTLKSDFDGYIVSLNTMEVVLMKNDFNLEVLLPLDQYQRLQLNDQATYSYHNKDYLTKVIRKYDYPVYNNGDYYYRVDFELTNKEDLLPLQQMLVRIGFRSNSGFIVENEAIYKDKDGLFVLERDFKNDLNNYKRYRIAVKVLYSNDKQSIITGVGLENLAVCILDELLTEVLFDD